MSKYLPFLILYRMNFGDQVSQIFFGRGNEVMGFVGDEVRRNRGDRGTRELGNK